MKAMKSKAGILRRKPSDTILIIFLLKRGFRLSFCQLLEDRESMSDCPIETRDKQIIV
jgi:hypothetical protein